MSFKTIHTAAGLQAMSDAEANGTKIDLVEMAVGDGGGAPVTPAESQTALMGEVYRAAINRVYRPDPTGKPALYTAELVVPAAEAGFTMREVGVFDAGGSLFAVGSLPETYKPEATEGSFSDSVVRLQFLATNTDIVTLQVDPGVTVATQAWVVQNLAPAQLIPGGNAGEVLQKQTGNDGDYDWAVVAPGGTTGEVLTKTGNADGAYDWQNPADVNVIVDTIEEYQTLSAGQTEVTLSTVTTAGLAVYLGATGERLPQDGSAGGWQPHGTDETKLTLGQSYSAGTMLQLVQNEPAGGFPDALLTGQNLADVPDKAAGRANLGVPSMADLQNAVPPGAVMYFARPSAPAGWHASLGQEVSRITDAALWDAVGTTFGAGNGVDTFNLPDLRGEFLRGSDEGRGVDPGRSLGSAQADQLGSHSHDMTFYEATDNTGPSTAGPVYRDPVDVPHIATTTATGGAETRPRNIALLPCIKR